LPTVKSTKNNFIYNKGLFTEGTPLNRPDGTSLDEENFELQKNGSRKRRKGLNQLETIDTQLWAQGKSVEATYVWDNPTTSVDRILVVRAFDRLYFKKENSDGSFTNITDVIELEDYGSFSIVGPLDSTNAVGDLQAVSANGRLFCTAENRMPFYLEYDDTNVTATVINTLERDLAGVDDGLGVATNPSTTYSNEHTYNLKNQGWPAAHITTYNGATSTDPSNSQVWYLGKKIDPATGIEVFDSAMLDAQDFGTLQAGKGRYIRDLINTGRSIDLSNTLEITNVTQTGTYLEFTTASVHGFSVSDVIMLVDCQLQHGITAQPFIVTLNFNGPQTVSAVPTTTTFRIAAAFTVSRTAFQINNYGFCTATVDNPSSDFDSPANSNSALTFRSVDFFAGRVFLAGTSGNERHSKRIYFSSLIKDNSHYHQFYSSGDPTSEHFSDPLETDGGYITIPEIGNIDKIKTFDRHLIVFADNGVWAISPGETGYFTAIDYQVNKISETILFSVNSIVDLGSSVVFISFSGINSIDLDKVTLIPVVQNISDPVIKSAFNGIFLASGGTVYSSLFDEFNNRIVWLYSTGSNDFKNLFFLDISIGGFYKYKLATEVAVGDGLEIISLYTPKVYTVLEERIQLIYEDRNNGSDYWNVYTCNFGEDSFLDFASTDFSSYLITSHELGVGPNKKKWGRYVWVYFNRTEDTVTDVSGQLTLSPKSSCLLRARWDFTDNSIAGKWGPSQEVYRLQRYIQPTTGGSFDNGYPVVVTKNKVRGSGRALNLRFDSSTGKDLQLLGWAIERSEEEEEEAKKRGSR